MDLYRAVLAEIEWDPVVRQAQLSVAVAENAVTLRGCVPCDAVRRAAEEAARRVRGVKTVINYIDVNLPAINHNHHTSDVDLQHLITLLLTSTAALSIDDLCVSVQDGWVTLSGRVIWRRQLLLAEHIVAQLRGVASIANLIIVTPEDLPSDTARQIQCALERSAGLDAQWITVEAYRGKVVLRGCVRSWQEVTLAEEIASRAPGVTDITSFLGVLP